MRLYVVKAQAPADSTSFTSYSQLIIGHFLHINDGDDIYIIKLSPAICHRSSIRDHLIHLTYFEMTKTAFPNMYRALDTTHSFPTRASIQTPNPARFTCLESFEPLPLLLLFSVVGSSVEFGVRELTAAPSRGSERPRGGLGCSSREGVMRLPLEGRPEMPKACRAASSSRTAEPAANLEKVRS